MLRRGEQKFFADLGAGKGYCIGNAFQVMFDAAPAIESEAEKKAAHLIQNANEVLGENGKYSGKYFKFLLTASIEIIRALLAERGMVYEKGNEKIS